VLVGVVVVCGHANVYRWAVLSCHVLSSSLVVTDRRRCMRWREFCVCVTWRRGPHTTLEPRRNAGRPAGKPAACWSTTTNVVVNKLIVFGVTSSRDQRRSCYTRNVYRCQFLTFQTFNRAVIFMTIFFFRTVRHDVFAAFVSFLWLLRVLVVLRLNATLIFSFIIIITRGQSNLTKSASRGGGIPRLGVTPGVESCIIEFLG